MATSLQHRFAGRMLGVATMHGKERMIGPPLMKVLPLAGYRAILDLDTDRFGAFSGEVQRTTDPLTAAIAKAKHGAEVSGMDLVIASEGSFGPYPLAPFLSCNEEFLLLFDARDGSTYAHKHLSLETVFGGERCTSLSQVTAFAQRMKFPEHGLVLRPKEKWELGNVLEKGIHDADRLRSVADELISINGSVWVETDMRAMANPTRMRVIAQTAERFAAELASTCAQCGMFHFRITDVKAGLPCQLCGWPTKATKFYIRECAQCHHRIEEPRPDGKQEEDPQHCDHCNP